jgi:hypothetical protein
MNRGIVAVLLLWALAGCGDDDASGAREEPTSAPSTASESPTAPAAGESQECLVAAQTWADRATDHVLEAATTASAFGETLKLENLDDLGSEISVLCSDELDKAVKDAMLPLTRANYELSLCAFDGSCDPQAAKKVRKFADQAASAVGDVRSFIP